VTERSLDRRERAGIACPAMPRRAQLFDIRTGGLPCP
jgi:hypothetical protein